MFISSDADFGFNRILCVGVSLGGHSTYHVLSDGKSSHGYCCAKLTYEDPRVTAGVVIIGCPDPAALMKIRAGKDKAAERLPDSFLETVRRLSPKFEEVAKKDMLILKGNDDVLVPWEPSQRFVDKLPKGKVSVVGYDGVGHALTDAMIQDTAKWIKGFRQRS